jgi:hypothetical protein
VNKDLLISMLRKGNTGDQILQILDAITESDDNQPTLEEIAF